MNAPTSENLLYSGLNMIFVVVLQSPFAEVYVCFFKDAQPCSLAYINKEKRIDSVYR